MGVSPETIVLGVMLRMLRIISAMVLRVLFQQNMLLLLGRGNIAKKYGGRILVRTDSDRSADGVLQK